MAEEEATTQFEEEPMTTVDEVDDSEAVKELDEMFKNRFTENDQSFVEVLNKEEIPPPVITNFLDLKYQRLVKFLCILIPLQFMHSSVLKMLYYVPS